MTDLRAHSYSVTTARDSAERGTMPDKEYEILTVTSKKIQASK